MDCSLEEFEAKKGHGCSVVLSVLNLLTVLEIPLWKAEALCSTSFMLSSFWYPQMIFCLSDWYISVPNLFFERTPTP